ncbi:MAG: DUF4286 family protein [Chitinophagaceae bacterium]
MTVYNITLKVSPEIEKQWLLWQTQEHIPDVMASGCFTDHKFFRLLEQDESEGATYVVQYFAPSLEDYERYINQVAPVMRQKLLDKWGNKIIAFRTVMQVVN